MPQNRQHPLNAQSPADPQEPTSPPGQAGEGVESPLAAPPRVWINPRFTGVIGSFLTHATLLFILALLAPTDQRRRAELMLAGEQRSAPEEILIPIAPPLPNLAPPQPAGALQLDAPLPTFSPIAPHVAAPFEGQPSNSGGESAFPPLTPAADLLMKQVGRRGGGWQGRSQQARSRLLAARGGSPASEDAVALGLQWLAEHQSENGSWRFDLQGPCRGQCENAGTVATTTGATALALLPFLGAGHTHIEGPYRDTVQRGIYYLTSRMLKSPHGGDFQEGTMYAQGLAAIALCEAYGMTRDEALRPFAQAAIDFICHAQHPRGGWRYFPGQPGDTTVTGWQLMALKSARLAGLEVPSPVIELVKAFLDSVQLADGALYGYQEAEKAAGPTAVALLCRMLLGWTQKDDRLRRGVDFLIVVGPSPSDMYFNYYSAMVLNHHDGPQWPAWNVKLRDYLVETQAQQGHQRGSWFFHDKHGDLAGRLYNTAMCIMTLEVYYRYMPLYGEDALDDLF